MASLSQIHPQVTPLPLAEALADIEEWEVDPEGVVPDEQPLVTGVTVSTQDSEPGWIFVGGPGNEPPRCLFGVCGEGGGGCGPGNR